MFCEKKQRLRILLWTRIFELAGGGAENYAFRLCQALAERGHELHVVAERCSSVSGINVYRGMENLGRVLTEIIPDITVDWGLFRKADIHRLGGGIHKSFLHYSLRSYPSFIRWYKVLRNYLPRNRAIIRRQEELLANRKAIFLANSQFGANQTIGAGAHREAVYVLHNGVDTTLFCPGERANRVDQLRARWGLNPSDVAVLFVAHNLVLKNFSLVNRLFNHLSAELPQLKLIVIGKHRPRRLPSNSFYAGEQTDMVPCYQAADCVVHPTFYDSCSNVVLEAMSCGLPVLASNVCGANELIQHGRSGFVLPVSGQQEDITSQWMHQLLLVGKDAQLRSRVGENARNSMSKNDFKDYVTRFEAYLYSGYDLKKTYPETSQ